MWVHLGIYHGNKYNGPTVTREYAEPLNEAEIMADIEKELAFQYPAFSPAPADMNWIVVHSDHADYIFPLHLDVSAQDKRTLQCRQFQRHMFPPSAP
ncbi:MAG TPA: hypothetical protein VGP89_03420 [Candidatus Angelobacter sp.]|jgi:hypothetical protein|nr:hypothetical protein [Candidatus Angelobacter sp.]